MLGPAGQSMGRACLDETTPRPSAPDGVGLWPAPRVGPRSNAIIIAQRALGIAKIDPLMVAFNAIALMAMNPENRFSKPQMFFVRVELPMSPRDRRTRLHAVGALGMRPANLRSSKQAPRPNVTQA